MNKNLLILSILIITSCGPSRTYLDENGKEISYRDYLNFFKESHLTATTWDYKTPDSGRVSQIVKPKYSPYMVKYPLFKKRIEEITSRKFENKIFLISYKYTDDLCSREGNELNKSAVENIKDNWSASKKYIEDKNENIVILIFFEQGYTIANSPYSQKEYLFQDRGNFLRESIFRTRAVCGSLALVKPNGETLVRNGESSVSFMEQLLKPENWEQFFTD